jgi:hypothetical protein
MRIKRQNLVFRSFGAAVIIMLCSMFASAQEFRGVISGQVTDPSGAVVPNAMIEALREGTQQPYTAQSNGSGIFSIPYVLPGRYDITVEAPGFKKAVRTGVNLDVSQKLSLTIALEVGSVAETVTVQETPSLLSTGDASGGTVIDAQKTQDLPLNGRQIYTLMLYAPGVRYTGGNTTRGWDQTNSYVINGVQNSYNQFTLNGAPISQQISTGRGTWFIAPNVDSVQEVKIQTNTYDASYGRAGGGTVNVVTKAGTKSFHGTAFDFWRGSVLEANTFQNNQRGVKKPFHNQHDFGGTVGGPVPGIGKDNTFFFFSFEGWRESAPQSILTSAPRVDVRPRADGSVDFRTYFANQLGSQYNPNGPTSKGGIFNPFSCATTNSDGTCATRNRFSYNGQLDVIPPNMVRAIGLKILSLYPLPNNPAAGEFNNYISNAPGSLKFNQPIIRIDHNFSDKTRFYGMFSYWSGLQFQNNTGYTEDESLKIVRGNINSYRSFIHQILDLTHTFSPTVFGDLRFSFGRSVDRAPNGAVAAGTVKLTPGDLGFTNYPLPPTTTEVEAPTIQVGGYPDIIGNNKYGDFGHPPMNEMYELSPTLTHSMGRHSLRYGAQFMLLHAIPCCGAADASGIGVGPGGRFSFSGAFTQQNPNTGNSDGAAIASLLLGAPSGGFIPFSYDVYESYRYFGLYLQDDFKLRRNLTLNLGLRWDIESSPVERFHKLNAGFDYSAKSPLQGAVTLPANNIPLANNTGLPLTTGQVITGTLLGGFNFSSDKLKPYDTQKNHWQPKFGLSWAINDKTVLRGGWGRSYAFAIELGGNTTWTQNTNYNQVGTTPSAQFNTGNPYPTGLVVPPGNIFGLLSGVGNGQSFDQRDRQIPVVQQYSFGFQRQLPGSIVLDVSYVGTRTNKLRVGTQFNALPTDIFNKCTQTPTFCTTLVRNPFFWQNLNPASLPAGFLDSYKSTTLGAAASVQVSALMVPFPHFSTSLFSNTEPIGSSNYNSLAVRLEKRISGGGALIKGLSLLTSFTWSRTMAANGFLNNGGAGLRDAKLFYAVTGSDRPFDLAFAGTWGVPIGKGGVVASNAHGLAGQVLNHWDLGWILTADSGTPIGLPNGTFFSCPGHPSYLPDKGKQSYTQWLYNENPACFRNFPQFTPTTVIPRVSYIRGPANKPQLALSLGKKFGIWEGKFLQLKAEVFNVTNTRIFGGPSTGSPTVAPQPVANIKPGEPGSFSGYGTIGSTQQNVPRQAQLSLKFLF